MPKFSYNSIYEKTRNNMTVSVFLMCCKDTDKHITINTSHYQPTCVHSFTHMQLQAMSSYLEIGSLSLVHFLKQTNRYINAIPIG